MLKFAFYCAITWELCFFFSSRALLYNNRICHWSIEWFTIWCWFNTSMKIIKWNVYLQKWAIIHFHQRLILLCCVNDEGADNVAGSWCVSYDEQRHPSCSLSRVAQRVWCTCKQQTWGERILFTACGRCCPILGYGHVPGASPCRDRGGHPCGRMLLLISKTKAGIVKADAKGTRWRGCHGWWTQDNRINHMKNATAPHIGFLFGDEGGFEKTREACIMWGLFI